MAWFDKNNDDYKNYKKNNKKQKKARRKKDRKDRLKERLRPKSTMVLFTNSFLYELCEPIGIPVLQEKWLFKKTEFSKN